jgi:hypothetical protein
MNYYYLFVHGACLGRLPFDWWSFECSGMFQDSQEAEHERQAMHTTKSGWFVDESIDTTEHSSVACLVIVSTVFQHVMLYVLMIFGPVWPDMTGREGGGCRIAPSPACTAVADPSDLPTLMSP